MSSRDNILGKLASLAFDSPLPEMPVFEQVDPDVLGVFSQRAQTTGAGVQRVRSEQLGETVSSLHPGASRVGSSVERIPGTVSLDASSSHHEIGALDVFVCQAELAVAENGAVWLSDLTIPNRAALFATQHLVILVHAEDLVSDMHDAYRRIEVGKQGFGLFVCGPSKTADIEQSLVVGAHGPRSLEILIVEA